jgi:DNA-binding transcriptional regulator YiaG
MVDTAFRELVKDAGFTQNGLAAFVDVNERRVRRWCAGAEEPMKAVVLLLLTMVANGDRADLIDAYYAEFVE